jgi:hypothetical protein
MSYETSQTLIVVFAALIVIGFILWVFAEQWKSSTKSLFSKVGIKTEEENQ